MIDVGNNGNISNIISHLKIQTGAWSHRHNQQQDKQYNQSKNKQEIHPLG